MEDGTAVDPSVIMVDPSVTTTVVPSAWVEVPVASVGPVVMATRELVDVVLDMEVDGS